MVEFARMRSGRQPRPSVTYSQPKMTYQENSSDSCLELQLPIPTLMNMSNVSNIRQVAKTIWFRTIVVVIWITAMFGGAVVVARYGLGEGAKDRVLTCLPEDLRETSASDVQHLFVFLHPRCPCSRATVQEFLSIVDRIDDRCDCTAYLVCPGDTGREFAEGKILEALRTSKKINIVYDLGGDSAKRMGVRTSGHTFLFSASGNLLFEGGITGARGQIGENGGKHGLSDKLASPGKTLFRWPVYGCPTQSPDQMPDRMPSYLEGNAG